MRNHYALWAGDYYSLFMSLYTAHSRGPPELKLGQQRIIVNYAIANKIKRKYDIHDYFNVY